MNHQIFLGKTRRIDLYQRFSGYVDLRQESYCLRTQFSRKACLILKNVVTLHRQSARELIMKQDNFSIN
jgi:hypothetical protein